ncbi:MAG: response regulator transcription factor [Betaproteobacteria bacterium]|nr:response regulator transcription factor [Betaproteobacteria bacterium]
MNTPTVFVVDDDAAVRDGLTLLCESAGLDAESFDSAESFLERYQPPRCGCLVLDMRLPGMSGRDLQEALAGRDIHLPIIFLTAHGDIPTTVEAMKAGAVDFLTKPVDGSALLARVQAAAQQHCRDQDDEHRRHAMRERMTSLTEREREILTRALAGQTNKDIARNLGISHRTVETYRSRLLLKTGAASLLELAAFAGSGTPAEGSQ